MNWKIHLSRILRLIGLIRVVDFLRFLAVRLQKRKENKRFKRLHPSVVLPPDYLMYESFQLDYHRYYVNGRKTAKWLVGLWEKHLDLTGVDILEWGCGPGRIIRHLPDLLPQARFFGIDYNSRSIHWCQQNLPDITFWTNNLLPPIPSYVRRQTSDVPRQTFSLIYGVSIFTHLSESAHFAWMEEFSRVLQPGGILFLTLHGQSFHSKLSRNEQLDFERGKLVVRGSVKEGHRTFTAFHPPEWVNGWARGLTCLEHLPGDTGEQDVWIFRNS